MPGDVLRGEGPDVEALHRALVREPSEPGEGREPAPAWLWVLAGVALFVAGWMLGRHATSFDAEVVPWRVAATAPPPEVAMAVIDGATVYTTRCASCHQADGRGVPGAFPPLVGSEWVQGSPETMAKIVLHGLTGPIVVAGQTYNGAMPGWGDQLGDDEIAAVLTHEREMAGVPEPAVPTELVAEVRAATADRTAPYTAQELTP